MSRQIHYLVQTTPTDFLHERGVYGGLSLIEKRGAEGAARLSITEARRLWRHYCAITACDAPRPRRFPRIIKVTVETKTITPPAKRRGRKSDFVV